MCYYGHTLEADACAVAADMWLQVQPTYVLQMIVDELHLLGKHGMLLQRPGAAGQERVYVKLVQVLSDYPGLMAMLGRWVQPCQSCCHVAVGVVFLQHSSAWFKNCL